MVLCHAKLWINSRSVREYAAGKAGGVPRRICFDAHVKTAAANAAAALARFKCLWSNPMDSLRHTDNKKETIRMDGFVSCETLDQQQICTGILRRRCRLRATAHFLLALPKAAMQCIAAIWRWQNACGRTRWVRSDIRITKKETIRLDGFFFGDPYGNRTHVTAVKGRCLNRLTNGPGSGNLTRTDDTPGMNRMLYQLSYAAI